MNLDGSMRTSKRPRSRSMTGRHDDVELLPVQLALVAELVVTSRGRRAELVVADLRHGTIIAECEVEGRTRYRSAVDIGDDGRFARGIAIFNEREFEEAAELFEELFLEAVCGETELARALLQFAAGAHHIERGQRRVAIERIDEGLIALAKVGDARGVDVETLRGSVADFVRWIETPGSTSPVPWPTIRRAPPPSRA